MIFDDIRSAAIRTGLVAIDYETTGLSSFKDKLLGAAIAVPGASWWVPIGEPLKDWIAGLRSVFECGAQVVMWKAHFDQAFHPKYGLPLYGNVHDAKAGWWLLEPHEWAPQGLKDRIVIETGRQVIHYH